MKNDYRFTNLITFYMHEFVVFPPSHFAIVA